AFFLFWFFKPNNSLPVTLPKPRTRAFTAKAWGVYFVLGLTILFWLTSSWHGLNESVVALIAAAVFTAAGILTRQDVDSIDWNILILMWGGLSLGNAMS